MPFIPLRSLCHPHFEEEGTRRAVSCPSLQSWEMPEMELNLSASHSS